MSKNLEERVDKLESEIIKDKEKIIGLYANGWYRVAVAYAEQDASIIPTACQIKIATKWGNQPPMTCIASLLTSQTKASITEVAKLLYSTNKHIDKLRIQYDEASKMFYLDAHYSLTNLSNQIFTNIISPDNFWKLADANEVTEYTTVAELNL